MSNISKSFQEKQKSILSGFPQSKSLEDLNMIDSFLFEGTTESVENAKFIAKVIIKRVTGLTVENLTVETEKQLKGISLNKRGIRMDVFATEKENERAVRLYDIEPNKYEEPDIPKRSRYYQSLIDSKLISPNTPFHILPDSISIWILPYDPFGDDRMVYTVKNYVAENTHIKYNDGVTKLFLYTKGTKGGSKELKDLLTFMENTTSANAVDDELLEIQKIVDRTKSSSDVKERYMTLQEVIDYEKRDSYNAGRDEGINAVINICKSFHLNKRETITRIVEQFSLPEDKADEYINLYW